MINADKAILEIDEQEIYGQYDMLWDLVNQTVQVGGWYSPEMTEIIQKKTDRRISCNLFDLIADIESFDIVANAGDFVRYNLKFKYR